MDWGYESETGQVWLFNVTPFTPHLPHWLCVCLCVCMHVCSVCYVKLCFLCAYWYACACTHAHSLTASFLLTWNAQCDQHISWSSDM